MYDFKVVSDPKEIPKSGWVDAPYFKSEDQLSCMHKGRRYNVIAIKEKTFSKTERRDRIIMGTILAVATLGIALLFQSCRNLFKEKVTVRYGMEPLKKKEQKGVSCFKSDAAKPKRNVLFAKENQAQHADASDYWIEKEPMKTVDGKIEGVHKLKEKQKPTHLNPMSSSSTMTLASLVALGHI